MSWVDANQQYVTAALARLCALLDGDCVDEAERTLERTRAQLRGPSALEQITEVFGLSPFERDLLLLCAGVELDAAVAARCAAAQGEPHRCQPTASLALARLPDAHWSALAPAAPLRRFRLIEVGQGETLTSSPLRIDERVLHHLAGVGYLDERLEGLLEALLPPPALVASHDAVADSIATAWRRAPAPLVQLTGPDPAAARAAAAAAATRLGLRTYAIDAHDVPASVAERDAVLRLWERETLLSPSALVVDAHELDGADARRTVEVFAAAAAGPVAVCASEPLVVRRRRTLRIEVRRPTRAEQRELWEKALGARANGDGALDALVCQFDLGLNELAAATAGAVDAHAREPAAPTNELLWETCRAQARPQLDDLAQRIEPAAVWKDLVLPAAEKELLREIAAHVRQRATVYEAWQFAAKGARGLGISALFAGASGTGKTMAAEVLAAELHLDLYRIDLSQVVSKYIGETEKNLRRVFDAAEGSGTVLLFDEADALFGQRSEVRDSHDRYANIEVSYLLQRMESYRGLAILTTNRKEALDDAFLRRLRFVVRFPFPDELQRAEIWRRVFPDAAPVDGLDAAALARLAVAGGNIRNIALYASFLAADEGLPIGTQHVRRAAQREYAKLERPLTAAERAAFP